MSLRVDNLDYFDSSNQLDDKHMEFFFVNWLYVQTNTLRMTSVADAMYSIA